MDSYYNDAQYAAVIGVVLLISFIAAIAGYVIGSLFLMKIFEKAGVQGKWRAWIPVYNTMIFFKLADLSPWLVLYGLGGTILLSWIGIGAIFSLALGVLSVLAAWRVGLKLQKDAVWVILYIFLSVVWLGINAFDKSRWNNSVPPAPWAGNGFLGDRTSWDGVPSQPSAAAAPQGYGAPQGYSAPSPQGYAPPAPQGYAPPAQPGYAPPAQPGYTPPAVPPTGAPAVPPVPPAPPAAPPAPPAPPTNPTQPPA